MTDQLVRLFSIAGPCLVQGRLVRETAQFYVYQVWIGSDGAGQRVYGTEHRVAKARAHVEPCRCCRDHADTIYANGYMG